MKIEIKDETIKEIEKYILSNSYYADWPIDQIIDSLINIGLYAKRCDGFDGSVHLKRNGDFGING